MCIYLYFFFPLNLIETLESEFRADLLHVHTMHAHTHTYTHTLIHIRYPTSPSSSSPPPSISHPQSIPPSSSPSSPSPTPSPYLSPPAKPRYVRYIRHRRSRCTANANRSHILSYPRNRAVAYPITRSNARIPPRIIGV